MAKIDTKNLYPILQEVMIQSSAGGNDWPVERRAAAQAGTAAAVVFFGYYLSLVEKRPLPEVLRDLGFGAAEELASRIDPDAFNLNIGQYAVAEE